MLFDMLAQIMTGANKQMYQGYGDRAYEWMIGMYDPITHTFSRGARWNGVAWEKDGIADWASDTSNWPPLARMLNDPRMGATEAARFAEIEAMLEAVKQRSGIMVGGRFMGIDFAGRHEVVSIEWSSQLALRYLALSKAFGRAGYTAKMQEYQNKYND